METRDLFTFRSKAVMCWLSAVVAASLAIAFNFPPAFWLSGVGVALAVLGQLAQSARTGQWYTSDRWEPRLNWFEGWTTATGSVMALAPLLTVIVRNWLES